MKIALISALIALVALLPVLFPTFVKDCAYKVHDALFAYMANQGLVLGVFANVSDIVATTIEQRSRKIQDNVTKNNALLAYIQQSGGNRPFGGGSLIYEELSFAENGNAGWYSGYDLLPVAASDVISAAAFDIRQAAVPVIISGLEELKNDGREQMINLMDGRLKVAESTMMNLVAAGTYSDGTGAGGKQLIGLDLAVPVTPTSGTYGGIDRATWAFWRSKSTTAGVALTSLTVQAAMNTMWASLVRGMDKPNLILMDNNFWSLYMSSLQPQQRFTDPTSANLGFPSIKFMGADVILDGGIGGFATTKTAYFLNTKYLYYRPHSKRNMVPLNPSRRYAINQDAEVQILAFAGNMTCSGAQFQGRLITP
jgi:hypothetical protein